MSAAPNYVPSVSFATEESNQVAGRSTVRTTAVDIELANVSSSINAMNNNLQLLQRDDGKLLEGIVEMFSLSEATRILIATGGRPRGLWQPSTQYEVGDILQNGVVAYMCYTAHTSGLTFASSGLFITLSGDGSSLVNAQAAAASAAASLISETNAAASAASALTSKNSATTSATSATNSATSATNSATSAAASQSSATASANLAEKWASEIEDVPVIPGEFSAKHWASKAMVAVTGMLSKAGGVMTGLLNLAAGADIASASTVDLTAATGNTVRITGTTAITAFTMNAGQQMELIAVGALPLTYNATTMNINGGVSYTCAAGDRLKVFKDGAGVVRVNVTKQDGFPIVPSTAADIGSFTAVANTPANSITITAPAATRAFRNSTLNNGQPIQRTATTAKTLVISSGSTLGIPNGVLGRVAVLAIDNGTDWDLGVVNLAGGVQLDETNLISTTAEGGAGAADSASVIYSTSALSSKPYRVIGFLDTTQATSGTYVTALSLVQGTGGQAMAALSSLGYGQTWQNLTGSRALSTTYYNTTGKPIVVFCISNGSNNETTTLTVNGVIASRLIVNTATGAGTSVSGIVPVGASYSITASSAIASWTELR